MELKVFENLPYIDPNLSSQTNLASQYNQPGGCGYFSTLQVGAGSTTFKVDKDGGWAGADKFANAPFSFDMHGNVIANSIVINGLSGSVLASSIDSSGNFIKYVISDAINTQTKLILGEFQFSGSGALAIKTDANNGIWLSPTGILGKKAGSTTFALDVNGNATFGGNLVAASGTLGSLTGGSITGSHIQTATSGARIILSGTAVYFYIDNVQKGSIMPDANNSMLYSSDGNHFFFRNDGFYYGRFSATGLELRSSSSISFISGSTITDAGAELQIDRQLRVQGMVYPRYDNTDYYDLGKSDKRWKSGHVKDMYARNYYSEDITFLDHACPICGDEFQTNNPIILWPYKKDEQGVYTVPAHFNCVNKKFKDSDRDATIRSNQDISEQKRQIRIRKEKILKESLSN